MTVAKSRNQVGGRSKEEIFKSKDLTHMSLTLENEWAKVVLNFGKIGLFTAPEQYIHTIPIPSMGLVVYLPTYFAHTKITHSCR